jgi:hypothetical protein
MEVNLRTLKQFLEILRYSFDVNTDLKEFIDNISYGNVRQAIEFLTVFIGSGHIDTHKILSKDSVHLDNGVHKRYTIALHEFIRAIIFKENQYFNPVATEVINLFDIVSHDGKEHFIKIILLDYFLRYHSLAQSEGFHSTKKIVEYLQNFGYNFSQINFALTRLNAKKLVESDAREELQEDTALPEFFRVTTTGAYHVRRLLDMFVYTDSVIVDTPILDDTFREKIKDVFSIEERIERAEIFLDYLDKKWNEAGIKVTGFNWSDHSILIRKDMKDIHSRTQRNF